MISNYYSFKVNIVDKIFYTEEGNEFPKTAIITLFDKNNKVIISKDFGYIDTIDIYNHIDKNEQLNLDYCYIKNFSITTYRRLRLIDKKDYVSIKGISAKHAFFDSNFNIDFSFIKITEGGINFSNTHFAEGDLNFNNTHFGIEKTDFSYAVFRNKKVDFSNTIFGNKGLNFKNAIFHKGTKDFQYADFGYGDAIFTNTDFSDGDVSFINTNFNDGNVSFKVAHFGKGNVVFHFAKFGKGQISFERTDFGDDKIDFRTVEFNEGKANFNRANFGEGELSFEASSSTQGKITFKRTNFGKGSINFELVECENTDVIFEKAIFGHNDVSFFNSKFNFLSLKSCHLDNYMDLRVKKCNKLNLSDTIARDIIDLKPYDFNVNINTLNLTGMRLLGCIYIDWFDNNVKKIIYRQTNTNFKEKADQFRTLKESFNKTGHYNDEDRSYVEFKRCEAKSKLLETDDKSKVHKIKRYIKYWIQWLTFDQAGYYATDPLRVLMAMVGVYIIFSLLFIVIFFIGDANILSATSAPALTLVERSFYHSAITFLTIGYGDYYPIGWSRVLSPIEGFAGMFLMSYFTVALVRKILR
ncbi:MAG: hypothetical protein KAG95_04280 [Bacteroidales bacterium]|nr:hypothetical protein [Bacteroidales bacterium]